MQRDLCASASAGAPSINGITGDLSAVEEEELAELLRLQVLSLDACDIQPEPYMSEEPTGLEGEELEQFNRRRNAFHSRKKRRRKKEYKKRLQLCREQVSRDNKRLKIQHALLSSATEKAKKIVQMLEANNNLVLTNNHLSIVPINTNFRRTPSMTSAPATLSGYQLAPYLCLNRSQLDPAGPQMLESAVGGVGPTAAFSPTLSVGMYRHAYQPGIPVLGRQGFFTHAAMVGAASPLTSVNHVPPPMRTSATLLTEDATVMELNQRRAQSTSTRTLPNTSQLQQQPTPQQQSVRQQIQAQILAGEFQ